MDRLAEGPRMERTRQEGKIFQPGGKPPVLRATNDYHNVEQGINDDSQRINKSFKALRNMNPPGVR